MERLSAEHTIKLVENGIFPITKDRFGQDLPHTPDTEVEFPGTFQGEGKMVGIPCLFVRTAGCNLRCVWSLPNGEVSLCDTPYSSFDLRGSGEWDVHHVIETLVCNMGNLKHLVISGGEPMIQHKPLLELCSKIKEWLGLHITIETNGTIFDPKLAKVVDFFSLSPKLKNSTPNANKLKKLKMIGFDNFELLHEQRRIDTKTLQKFIKLRSKPDRDKYDFQLKFVISNPSEEDEIKELLSKLKGWKPEDIVLMPVGINEKELKASTNLCWAMAVRNGWRFTPRLHIDVFGDKPGV